MARPLPSGRVPRAQVRHQAVAWHGFTALACGIGGLLLAVHHPLAPVVATIALSGMALLFSIYPGLWLLLLPAVVPLLGLAPWTGWISFEEWDLLAAAAAMGGYARLALSALAKGGKASQPPPIGLLAWLLSGALAVSTAAAMARGFADAGGFQFGWFQGYREPMNSLRLGKALFAALLLLPLWCNAQARDAAAASGRLVVGLSLGLLGVSLATMWERSAFTDLLNFSTDYRTTALFWEMHVGGAALDGWLALTLPVAVGALLVPSLPWRKLLLVVCVGAAAYACLTTFSRGVYLAIPIGLALTLALHVRQRSQQQPAALHGWVNAGLRGLLLASALAAGVAWMFPSSGYRGMLALLGVACVMLPLPQALRDCTSGLRLTGAAAGVLLAASSWVLADLVPRGPYLHFSAAMAMAALMLAWAQRCFGPPGRLAPAGALAAFVWLVSGMVKIAAHWGGPEALPAALVVAAAASVLLLTAVLSSKPAWPCSRPWQAMTAGGMLLAAAVVATFLAGDYMSGRFSASGSDLTGRLQHWQRGIAMLHGTGDWLLGRGLGRYVDNNAINALPGQRPGDYRLQPDADGNSLVLIAGTHVVGWGELLRISQRIDRPLGPVTVHAQVRAEKPANLHFEVCQKHLLYDNGCLIKQVQVPAKPGQWQALQASLVGEPLASGPGQLPKLVAFSLGTDTSGWAVAVRDLSLRDGSGRQLLTNGDFSDGMARWFFTSDRNHMPWHMKSMALHLLFDQGVLGMAAVAVLTAATLLRTTVGRARLHSLAPGLAGGIVAMLVVGLFDSLLDVPRLAFLFYFLLLAGVTLKAVPEPQRDASHRRRP